MARKWSNENLPGALHFITGNVLHRQAVFRRDDCSQEFLQNCARLRASWPCKIIAYVVMPDHFHLVVNPFDGKIKEFTGALKSLSARQIIKLTGVEKWTVQEDSEHQVWQESFHALSLWSNWMIWQKIHYIHANPIKAGIVKSAKDYQWTSFRAFYMETAEPIAIDHKDWWWPDDVQKLAKAMKSKFEAGQHETR